MSRVLEEEERRTFHLCVIKWIICVITANNKTFWSSHNFNTVSFEGNFFSVFPFRLLHRRRLLCAFCAITLRTSLLSNVSGRKIRKSETQLRKLFGAFIIQRNRYKIIYGTFSCNWYDVNSVRSWLVWKIEKWVRKGFLGGCSSHVLRKCKVSVIIMKDAVIRTSHTLWI